MGLVDKINSRMEPVQRADPVTLEEFGYLLSANQGNKSMSGVHVSPTRALGITAWYSGVRYLAETVSSLPCFTYRDDFSGRSKRADAAWRRSPDDDVPWGSWVEFQMMSMLHRGDGFSFKLRNPLGQVVGLRSLHPDRVKVGSDPNTGRKVFQVRDVDPIFTSREILHIPGLSYDGLRGIDVIRYHAGTLGATAAADEYAARFFDAGSHLNHYVQLAEDLTREQAIAKREQFQAFHQGLKNAHELGLLGGGAKLMTVGLDPAQTQLLETRKFGVTEVARILRIPPHKLYDLVHATFSNIEHQSIEAVVDSIRPWVVRIERHVNFDPDLLPARNFIEMQVEGLLRGDMASRYTAYGQGIQFGFLNRNEPRSLENLPERPELDAFLVPVNMREAGSPDPNAPEVPK